MHSTPQNGPGRAKFMRRPLRLALLAGAVSLTAGAAFAQTAEPKSDDAALTQVEEIMVTATKRGTILQDTPLPITAVTGETLTKAGAVTMGEYAKFVPSLKLSDDGPGRSRVILRGISGAGENLVGIFYDETPITGSVGVSSDSGGRNPDTTASDVERVEVLRGPQGTLFGGASMAGAIRLIMNKPKQTYEGFVSGGVTTTEGGGISTQITGMVNVPIIQDVLAARVVMYNRDNDGWIDNSLLNKKNINDSVIKGGRFLVRYTPTDKLTIDGAVYIQKTDAVAANTWNPLYGTYIQQSKLILPYIEDTRIYSLTGAYDFGFATLTANSSYFYGKSIYAADDTSFVAGYRTTARCATYTGSACVAGSQKYTDYLALVNSYYPAAIYYPSKSRNWTNEMRLASNGDGPLNWTVGVYAENRIEFIESGDTLADEASGVLKTPINFIYHRYIDDHLTQKAVFGEVSYAVTDKLTVTAGGRAFNYHKTVGGATDVAWLLINAPFKPYSAVSAKEEGSIFKFNANYDITDDVMVYGLVSQGFRPGGVNQVIGLGPSLVAYDSDNLTNYETGIKTAWFDRRLTLNFNVYQIDWDNMQVSGRTLDNAFSFISNAGAARVKGAEFEFMAAPISGLTINGNASYNDAKLTENQVNASVSAPGKAGDQLPNIPKVSAAIGVQYTRPVWGEINGFARADANYVGDAFSTLSAADPYRRKSPAYSMLNLRFGLEHPDGDWSLSAFVNNVFDKVAITRLTESASTPLGGTAVSVMPRTSGLSLTKKF